MSSGVSVVVNPVDNATTSDEFSISLNGSSQMTVSAYYDMINNNKYKSPVKVTSSGTDITGDANVTIKNSCTDSSGNSVDCKTLSCNSSYNIVHTVTYKGNSKNISRELTSGC